MMLANKYGPRQQDFLERHEDFLFKIGIIALVGIMVIAIAMML